MPRRVVISTAALRAAHGPPRSSPVTLARADVVSHGVEAFGAALATEYGRVPPASDAEDRHSSSLIFAINICSSCRSSSEPFGEQPYAQVSRFRLTMFGLSGMPSRAREMVVMLHAPWPASAPRT